MHMKDPLAFRRGFGVVQARRVLRCGGDAVPGEAVKPRSQRWVRLAVGGRENAMIGIVTDRPTTSRPKKEAANCESSSWFDYH